MVKLQRGSMASLAVWKTDVFVSFRGEDVRKTFVSHLFSELDRIGINAFRDDLDLERGKSISPELVDAIKSSRFAIVVVSKNYAASSWCLDELLKIMECKDMIDQTIVPVFYEVNPSDVRRQSGSFGEDVESHSDEEKVKKWKEALTKLASISGEDSQNWNDESKLIKKIVQDISDKLVSTSWDDSKELIGMTSHMDFLQSMMSIEDEDVRMVGIWGMGGVGKTTIAKYLYNQLSCRFEAHCFMENVKEVCKRDGVRRLQREFLCRLFRERDKQAWSSVSCCSIIKERLRHKRVLIVLDDVGKSEQLNELVKETDWFGPGSRIIVTTRDKHLLLSHSIDLVYKVKCLPKKEALQLFCNYAFRNEINIPHGFRELSVQAINYASGLPLALRVLGSFLYRRSQREWESTLARLETSPHSDIMDVLRVSYDGLNEQEKAIFLYISCFYNMKHLDYVTKLLDICGYAAEIGVTVLTEKSLIVVANGYIKMHDLLEQMGRELVRQQAVNKPAEQLLLWDPVDICDLLSENSGTQLVEGISLNLSEVSEVYASDRAFEGLSNLKLLNFYDLSYDGETRVHLPNGLTYLPRKLRYLRWDGYPSKTMPSRFHPEFLVELCMSNSNLEKLWDRIQPLRNLKKMDLSRCKYLVEIPNLSKATNLEELNLSYCQSLVEVTPSIKNLQKLYCLYLTNCIQLKNIPSGISLKSLETVGMSGCSSLMYFPEISWNTRRLYLNSTKIEELPSSIGRLSCLVELDMSDCQSLRTLPSSVRHLVSLKSINLDGCKHLENLPDSLQHLTSLETLEVSGCLNVNEFPRLATNIEILRIAETSIEEIPARICNLSQLRSLDISGNERLKSLPSIPPEICQTMSCLRWLDLDRTSIKELPENIGNLISLEVLQARRTEIRRAPWSIARLTRLQVFVIGNSFYNAEALHSLCPQLSRFDDLRALCLSNMNMIEIPNSIGCLWSLSELDLSGNNFEFIPSSIKRLTRLNRLDLNNCQRLQALPDELPRGLLYIYAHGCTSLVSISGCFKHHCLLKLVASNCYKLDQEAQILFHRNMNLDSDKPEHSYFPGEDVPSCFSHQAVGSSLRIDLPRNESSSDILGFSACIMIGVDGQYSMNDLKIHCSCILKGVDASKLVAMDELWYPDPKAFTNMCFGSDHLLLFSRQCMSMGAYNEALFEFSVENTRGDSFKPLGEVKKCAVHLISFKDMIQEQDSAASPQSSSDYEDIHNPYMELSEALDEAEVLKRKPYETEFLHKEQPNPKRIKFLPVPLARKQHSKLHKPNVTRE
ncbi:disease resistance protein [Arabis alpina]|uniref:ADP-ribosyl cyclase/cyclic ADP-ribose hydrolase n=1 Tax=Arabis alpina TaxID=50452 RepID=A0A087G7Z0_ARAAL|nr:disease resistance protein [Arabis alpina]